MKARARARAIGIASLGAVALVVMVAFLRYPAMEQLDLWLLDSGDPAVRLAAARRLGGMRSARGARRLAEEMRRPAREWLHAPEPYELALGRAHRRSFTVHFAVEPLARIGAPAVPALRELLAVARDDVRLNAAIALLEIGPPAREAAADLAACLRGTGDVRPAAAKALVRIGPASAPLLIEKLRDENSGVRYTAAIALGEIGPPAIPDLVRSLATAGRAERPYIAFALWSIGSRPERAWPALLEARNDPGPGGASSGGSTIPATAIEALKTLERDGHRILPLLLEAAGDPDEALRQAASEILERMQRNE